MGPVLIEHVRRTWTMGADLVLNKNKDRKYKKKAAGAILKREGMVGMLMRENKNSQVGKKKAVTSKEGKRKLT